MLYLNTREMKTYFLLGTEVPDSITAIPSKYIDVVTSQRVITKDQVPYTKDHNLEFNAETKRLTRDNLADMASRCQAKAEQMLGLQDCQAAAFYLGVMCHYIADAVFFPHIRDSAGTLTPNLALDHSLKWRIHYLTSRKISDWHYCNGQWTAIGPFFNYTDARIHQYAEYKNAYEATWWAAHHVCFGEAVSTNLFFNRPSKEWPFRWLYKCDDAWEMNMYYEEKGDVLPPGFDLTTLKTVERRNDYWANFPMGTWERNYLETLQHHLNLGVFYCAGVINYIKNSYTGCKDGISKEVAQYIEKLTVEYAFMWMMAWLGHFALFIVVAQTAASSSDKIPLFALARAS